MLPPLPPQVNNNKKPTSVISWLGFGLSLATFLILVISLVIAVVFHNGSSSNLIILAFFFGIPIGIIGFIFSIIGLVMAMKNNTPKWMSVSGIIFCCLSLLTPILIAMIGMMVSHEPDQTIEEDQAVEKAINEVWMEEYTDEVDTISITEVAETSPITR
jgi:uncharacterized integral membrane protein